MGVLSESIMPIVNERIKDMEWNVDEKSYKFAIETWGMVLYLPFKSPHIPVPNPDSIQEDRRAAILEHSPFVNAIKGQLKKEEEMTEEANKMMQSRMSKMVQSYRGEK